MATPIIMPRQGQSVESCLLTSWQVKANDSVTEGQIIATIETDKATFDVESPATGILLARFFEEGDDIPVLTTIAAVGQPGEDISSLRPGTGAGGAPDLTQPSTSLSKEASPVVSSPPPPAPEIRGVSPRARHLASAKGIEVHALAGTGPGGRVIERDVTAASAIAPRLTPAARDAIAADQGAPPALGTGLGGQVRAADVGPGPGHAAAASRAPVREDREIPVTGIRKIIAQRMLASLTSAAQLTLNRSFDATAILSFRRKLKVMGETFGLPSVTVNDLIAFATARTLVRHPELNAHFLGDKIIQYGRVNLGIAVDTPRGLMVPVLRNAAALSISEISTGIRPLAEACQKGSVNPDHLSGGTFTITNLGALGVESFTPVLNVPEVAILGVGGLTVKPIRTPNGIDHVDAINLSLTIDHQAVDGAPAARFLKDLCDALENIEILIAAGDGC